MARSGRIVWDHDAIGAVADSLAPEALAKAEAIKASADAMRARSGIAPYRAQLRMGRKGDRRYAVVSADARSTVANELRTNALSKAAH